MNGDLECRVAELQHTIEKLQGMVDSMVYHQLRMKAWWMYDRVCCACKETITGKECLEPIEERKYRYVPEDFDWTVACPKCKSF
jgi:hypothetical protein